MSQYQGAEWIEKSLKVDNMSELGKEAADFLGDVYLGIYHMNTDLLKKANWSDKYCIKVVLPWRSPMATYDNDVITRIVVLSHDRMLRVELMPHSFNYMAIMIHKRYHRSFDKDMFDRMPMLEDHIDILRKHYGTEIEQREL